VRVVHVASSLRSQKYLSLAIISFLAHRSICLLVGSIDSTKGLVG
jgi:hypothetical protein